MPPGPVAAADRTFTGVRDSPMRAPGMTTSCPASIANLEPQADRADLLVLEPAARLGDGGGRDVGRLKQPQPIGPRPPREHPLELPAIQTRSARQAHPGRVPADARGSASRPRAPSATSRSMNAVVERAEEQPPAVRAPVAAVVGQRPARPVRPVQVRLVASGGEAAR